VGVEATRIQTLREGSPDDAGSYVFYWMQQSQRAAYNPALEYAIKLANERDQAVVVGFGLYERYPDASERAFAFLLEGLAETAEALADRRIKLVLRRGRPDRVALELARDASLIVCDRGYLRHQRRWRAEVARRARCGVFQVEGDVVVPVEEVSDKVEHAARTIRPKIQKLRDQHIEALRPTAPAKSSLPLHVTGDFDPGKPDAAIRELRVDRTIARVRRFRGGTSEARRRLTGFLRHDLPGYADARNDPANPNASRLSPYLHFGQISPVEIARKVQSSKGTARRDREAFLEELVVRRELAVNFVEFEEHYDSFRCLPHWARKTLSEHVEDHRPERYTAKQLERAETGDRYWNAAMKEMKKTGYMHNYMRMYWGKKLLEWCNTPEYAYRTALALNNRYFLDGRDPASYANVAWIFGLHDRAWGERPIFGKVRYMNAQGLERKFDVDAYVRWVDDIPEGG
jgi:deoxyribodipyrimidine photo-lyase